MKIRSLRLKLTLPFALVYGLVSVCGIFWSQHRKLEFIRSELVGASRHYLEWSLALASIEPDPGQRQRFIASIAAASEVDWLLLYDPDTGDVLAGSRYEWNRKTLGELDAETRAIIAQGDAPGDSAIWLGRRLIHFGQSRISSVDGQESRFRTIRAAGSFNLDEGLNDLFNTSLLMGVVWLGGGIFLFACTCCLLQRIVLDRVHRLKRSMEQHSRGEPVSAPLGTVDDELGRLGESFREMLGQIESSSREVQRLALVASETDNGVIITDVDENIEWVNEGFTRITGYTLEEVRGRKPGAFLQGPNSSAGTIRFIREKVQARESFSAELINYAKNGDEYFITIDAKPLFERERFIGFIAIQRDDTERYLHEQQLRVEREKAEQANHAKSAFLAAMSHEIRTPMNGVIGVVRLLEETKLDAHQQELAGIIHRSGESLMTVINDILDFSRIEAGELKIAEEDFFLESAIEPALSLLIGPCEEKGLLLFSSRDDGLPRRARGDSNRIRQILFNLIGNAVKFTESGSVAVSFSCERLEDGFCLLKGSVADTGIGIAPGHIDGLFERFYQVDDAQTRLRKGTGLGLAIVKRLAELMGGSVSVESTVGEGSVFRFSVRLEVVEWEDSAAVEPPFKGIPAWVSVQPLPLQAEMESRLSRLGFRAVEDPGAARLVLCSGEPPKQLGPVDAVLQLVPFSQEHSGAPGCHYYRAPYLHSDLERALRSIFHEETLAAGQDSLDRTGKEKLNPPVAGISLLVVEDSKINQKVIGAMLDSIGLGHDLADDGVQAVQAFRETAYDLVLMDVHMPNMDGYEATRRIRLLPNGQDCVIVALSAGVLQEQEAMALAQGMNAFLSKPVKADDIRAVIGRFFPTDTLVS